jgi:ubiquitin-protein ligase
MWSSEQRQRLYLENEALRREGFDQFTVYYHSSDDTYTAFGTATANSGRQYKLFMPIPAAYPYKRPPLYVTEPNPLWMFNGRPLSSVGVSHEMHTLTPHDAGWPQICHWRDARWHSGILLHKVFLKALIWIEAYEQHLATGRPLADFVSTMAEAS